MKWKIVTDSGSCIRSLDPYTTTIDFQVVPMIIRVDDQQIIDDESLDTQLMLEKMRKSKNTSTACPSPSTYAEAFKGAEQVICFTLSSGVSGSYNAANSGKDLLLEQAPQTQIHIVDSKSAGAEMDLLILQTIHLIDQGLSFEQVIEKLSQLQSQNSVNYLLESVENLVKNGRIPKLVGQMIGLLSVRLIGKRSKQGTLKLAQKARGNQRAIKALVKEMIKEGYQGGQVIINHVHNPKLCQELKDMILGQFPNAQVLSNLASGLCSYYAQDQGLIVGYHCQ